MTVWYLRKGAFGTASVPFENKIEEGTWAQAPRRNWIDEQVLAKLRELNLPPSPRSGDGEFLRRAFLDTIGVLPTAKEVRDFLADTDADKDAERVWTRQRVRKFHPDI